MELIEQEFSPKPLIDIPGEVMDIYRLWRATPLYRARRLEKALDTPAHIYYKYEGTSPAGSHKPNTAVAQAYYNKRAGIRRLATETGAGQWGSALWRWPARCLRWNARSTWCASATTRNPTAA
jgi:tryptophan synthase beta chain